MNNIILPGDPLFDLTLNTAIPPKMGANSHVICNLETGMFENVSFARFLEYCQDGELAVWEELNDMDQFDEDQGY